MCCSAGYRTGSIGPGRVRCREEENVRWSGGERETARHDGSTGGTLMSLSYDMNENR
jgi:hypothetical protein